MNEPFDPHAYDRVEVVHHGLPGQEFTVTKNEKQEPQTFQRIILAPPKDENGNFFLEAGPTNFEKFLEFVSENFEMKKFSEVCENDPMRSHVSYHLVCKQHADEGAFHVYLDCIMEPGEPEMMRKIGKHLDEVEHSLPQVPHVWKEEQ